MAFADFAFRSYCGSLLMREPAHGSKRIPRSSSRPHSISLEEEIYTLRRKMEQVADAEQCLTAPRVVELSTILDKKLNEYMGILQQA